MTLLTPNRRLSATLLKQYNQTQLEKGISCWPSLDILPFQSWLQRLWNEYSTENADDFFPDLLTPQQETILWEDILQKSPASSALLKISATADLAKSAWGLLKQWQVNLSHPLLKSTEDSLAFFEWALTFQTLCEKNRWIATQRLADTIQELIEKNKIKPPKEIHLIGFTELSPQQKSLLNAFEKKGSKVTSAHTTLSAASIFRIGLTDEETEIRTMAQFAKAKLEESPSASIGCVVPDLERLRDRVSQIYSEVFFGTDSFNISAGKSLASYPVIHTAIQLLQLQSGSVSIETLSYLLRSPFLGEAEQENNKRAKLDAKLHNENSGDYFYFSDNHLLSSCPAFADRINAFLSKKESRRLPMSEWALIFIEHLTLLGWPGERSLNSTEYQVVQRWLDLLSEFQSSDTVLAPQLYDDALRILHQLAANTVFQPQSPEAPVQILGLLEAAELPFDYLWVMGLDDTVWPPPAKPNPFIPQSLQKTLQMPHATADRELEYSRRLMDQLINSTKHVIFSHALKKNDCELRPSSLITPYPEISNDALCLIPFIPFSEKIFASRSLEFLRDTKAPKVTDDEKIQGGAYIFKQQAACPFKAFADVRLHTKPIEKMTIGLKEKDRGTIIHKALELIWTELKDSETLNKTPETELKALIHRCANSAIQEIAKNKITRLRYIQLELERLENLLFNWLDIEKSRPCFKVISQEKEHSTVIGNVPITLRVDRVDELSDGTQFIIDYKTGKDNSIQRWLGERPDEPQLPLYCTVFSDHATAISFAHVRSAKPGFKGLSKNDLDIKAIQKIKDKTWDQQLSDWKTVLEKIGNDFWEGKADVAPKQKENTCRYCQLKSLCRIYE